MRHRSLTVSTISTVLQLATYDVGYINIVRTASSSAILATQRRGRRGTGHQARVCKRGPLSACKRGPSPICKPSSSVAHRPNQSASEEHRPASPWQPNLSSKYRVVPGQMSITSSPCHVQSRLRCYCHRSSTTTTSLPVSTTLGVVDNHLKVEVFVVQGNVKLAASRADLSLVLIALVGGDQLAVTPKAFQAYLSLRFCVSLSMARCVLGSRAFAHVCH